MSSDEKNINTTAFIKIILSRYPEKQDILFEIIIKKPTLAESAVNAIKLLHLEKQQLLLEKLIIQSIEKCNITLLIEINKIFPVNKLQSKSIREKGILLLKQDPSAIPFISNIMLQFTNGFGNIFYDGALLTLTEIAQRKKSRYIFNPTILKYYEINDYFLELSKSSHPLRERFIISHIHWNIGEILIDDKNHAKLLIIDSLGNKLSEEKYSLKEIIYNFSIYFQNSTIYVSKDLRQNTSMGCSMFALDDLRHLYTVEAYLPKIYSDLFDYLKKTSDEVKEKKIIINNKSISYFPCQLPLSLEMTRQDEKLLTEIIPQREIENTCPINNKKELPRNSAIKWFVEAKNKNGIIKLHNKRLENQLVKIARNNENFLLKHSTNEIKENMENFTLMGFKKKNVGT